MLGVWHFSFTVSNLERSIAFYTKLGLELLLTQEQANEYTSRLVGYDNAHLKIAPVCHSWSAAGTIDP